MSSGSGDEGLSYYAVAVARRDNPSVNFFTLKGTVACFPGEFGSFFTMFVVFNGKHYVLYVIHKTRLGVLET